MSKKITELSRLSAAANTDVLLIVENPGSTPTNKYIEVGDLMDNSGAVALGGLDIDGGTDIGTALADADLFIVDDGGAGTNRKVAASRIKTYALPAQSGQSGKFLTTDATNSSWATVDALPSQSGQSGKNLTTDGTNASWAAAAGGAPTFTAVADGTIAATNSCIITSAGKLQKIASSSGSSFMLHTTVTFGSTTATVTSTATLEVGMPITNDSAIPAGTTIVSITNATTFVMSNPGSLNNGGWPNTTYTPIVTNMTAHNLAGWATSSVSDGANVTVTLKGHIETSVTGLTAGSAYYVQKDGTLGTSAVNPSVLAGVALASNKLLVS